MTITSIITPAGSRKLVATGTARTLLDWGLDDVGETKLAAWVDQVSAAIETFAGRVFPAETVAETIEVPRSGRVLLVRYPVIEVVTVEDAAGDELAADAWQVLDQAAGILRAPACSTIMVEYSGGFASIPADLQGLVIEALRGHRATQERPAGLRSETLDGYQWQAVAGSGSPGGLTPAILAQLERWRDVRL